MIAIRAEANEHIASGHVMRCLSVADALFTLGEEVVFITADENAKSMIENRGHKVICLNSKWDDKDGELDRLIPELERIKPDLILVDSYEVTEHYLKTVRNSVKLAYLDDLNAFDYPADIVINYSIYAEDIDYPDNKEYILGTGYVPLRKQFDITQEQLERSIKSRTKNKQILITTGASDPDNITLVIAREILKEPKLHDYKITIVKGRFFDSEITEEFDKIDSDRIIQLENVENMAEVMLKSTLAVSAGGSTLYELCACLVPTVTFSDADNQLGNVNGFDKRGIMSYAGDTRNTKDLSREIVNRLLTYHENNDIMEQSVKKMQELDCGRGAIRLAKHLIKWISRDSFLCLR